MELAKAIMAAVARHPGAKSYKKTWEKSVIHGYICNTLWYKDASGSRHSLLF